MGKVVETLGYCYGESVLGPILVVVSERGLVGSFVGEAAAVMLLQAQRRFVEVHWKEGAWKAKVFLARVCKVHENPRLAFSFVFDMRTTAFRQAVWEAVLRVPAGEFASYRDIAREVGSPRAMRAVGSACAQCDYEGVVPCHRVLHSRENFETNKDARALRHHAMIQREVAFTGKVL